MGKSEYGQPGFDAITPGVGVPCGGGASGSASRYDFGGWGRKIIPAVGSVARIRAANIAAIAERLRDVQLECQDACDLLERVKGCDYAVIYADPPYRKADISAYPVSDLDLERYSGSLAAQRGTAGISGYANEWYLLGWRRVERHALRRQIKGNGENRMEVL